MKSIRSAIAALPLFAAALVFVGAIPAASFDATPYLHAQRLVDVGGRSLNLYCTGNGSPTVVLDSTGDDSTLDWRFVQPIVAKTTRVCSYDVAGLGFSDPAPTPRDASAYVRDLHALLRNAGIPRPVVLVGYGLSGLTDRLYSDRYPSDVAGMVLVDPNVPYEHQQVAAIIPALKPAFAQFAAYDAMCTTAAERGALHPGTPQYAACIYTPPDPTLPPALVALVHTQWQRPGLWRDFSAADAASETTSSAEVVREQRSYGKMPLIVLTETGSIAQLPLPQAKKTALTKAWLRWHEHIARFSSRGVDFLVNGSTQAIPEERPSSITGAIDEVIDQIRYRQ